MFDILDEDPEEVQSKSRRRKNSKILEVNAKHSETKEKSEQSKSQILSEVNDLVFDILEEEPEVVQSKTKKNSKTSPSSNSINEIPAVTSTKRKSSQSSSKHPFDLNEIARNGKAVIH